MCVCVCVVCVCVCVCVDVLGVCVSVCVFKFIQHAPLQSNTTCFCVKFYSPVTFTLLYIPSFSTVTTIELSACDLYN